MQQLLKHILLTFVLIGTFVSTMQGQYSRGNSPYSRYGLGDLRSTMFTPVSSSGGGLAATYRSFWDINLVNPASLGKLRYTSFQVGVDYQHSELSEKQTGITAQADNGNLSYLSLAFPITKSWEVLRDTLRRGVPLQWGMGFSLMPHSFVNYDVAVTRDVPSPPNTIPNVRFNYTGEGNTFRVNWSNGFTYKGISGGVNLGLLFGRVINTTFIDFQDTAYVYSYDNQFYVDQRSAGFVWDVGFQYEYEFKKSGEKKTAIGNLKANNKILIGVYAGGASDLITTSTQDYSRVGSFHPLDSIRSIADVPGRITMPLKIGGGISYGKELGMLIGFSYEGQLWSMFRRDGAIDQNVADAHRFALGFQITPDFADFTSFFNRIRYRVGVHYGLDARSLVASDNNRYQLMDYGLSVGFGLPMRPPKAKSILGFVNIGMEVGYLGHPQLINDVYFKVNLGFALNASGWFNRSKFR